MLIPKRNRALSPAMASRGQSRRRRTNEAPSRQEGVRVRVANHLPGTLPWVLAGAASWEIVMRARRMLAGAIAGSLLFVLATACGGGGGGGGGGGTTPTTDFIPFEGSRTYETTPVTGGGLVAAKMRITVTDLGSRANDRAEVTVVITTDDSPQTFNNTPMVVTSLTNLHIVGVISSGTKLFDVDITLNADGTVATVKLTPRDTPADQVQASAALVSSAPLATTADPTLMQAGNAGLSSVLNKTAQGQSVTLADVQAVRNSYTAAYQGAPNDPQAAFGYALSSCAAAGWEAGERTGLSDISLFGGGSGGGGAAPQRILGAMAGMYNPAGAVAALADAPAVAVGEALLPAALTTSPGTAAGRAREISQAQVASELENTALPVLESALGAIAVSANSTTFNFQVSFSDGTDTYTLNFTQADAKLVGAAIDLLAALCYQVLVYQWEGGDYDTPTVTLAEMSDQLLTPTEYLPASPVGVLRGNGTTYSRNALARLQSAADRAEAAWATINASNTVAGQNLDDLVSSSRALSAATRNNLTNGLAELKKLFAGKYTINYEVLGSITGDTVPAGERWLTSVNVPAFMTNPPQDLRSILPTFGEVARGNEGTDLAWMTYLLGTSTFESSQIVRGSFPNSGGLVSLGGLLDPPLSSTTLLANIEQKMEAHRKGPDGLFAFGGFDSWDAATFGTFWRK